MILRLQKYEIQVIYKPEKKIPVADALLVVVPLSPYIVQLST